MIIKDLTLKTQLMIFSGLLWLPSPVPTALYGILIPDPPIVL